MSEEALFIFNQLKAEGYPLLINKLQYSKIIGCSISSIDNYMRAGTNLPNYKKMGTAKNARVLFNLRDVANFIADQTTQMVWLLYGEASLSTIPNSGVAGILHHLWLW